MAMATPGPLEIVKEFLKENSVAFPVTIALFWFVQPYSRLVSTVALFFILLLFKESANISRAIYATFFRVPKILTEYGEWALITGATDGIGKAFCFQFAQRHLNLIIVGRSESKLQEMAKEIKTKYSVQCRYVIVDFAQEDLEVVMARIKDNISDLEVGILVNNVGLSYPYARFFNEVDDNLIRDLIRLNVEVVTKMVQLIIPQMVKRRKGCIVNMGSGAASILCSDPLYSLYAATKAFVDQFSRSLHVEYKHMGIDVQCQVPLYVATKMTKVRKPSLACPSADTYAKYAMRYIGYEARVTPYTLHNVLWWLAKFFNEDTVETYRLRISLNIRKRALMKEAQKKEAQQKAD